MSRLTNEPFRRKSDDSLENYKVRRYGREEWGTSVQKVINKLGKIEDLMQEYNINSIEELEILINSHKKQGEEIIDLSADLGMFQNENINLTKDIEKYWNIGEELGCPLEVIGEVFLDWSFVDETGLGVQITGMTIKGDGSIYFIAINGDLYDLKDYQKTWWLKGEKDESCTETD